MSHKDVCFLSLLALTYMLLDARQQLLPARPAAHEGALRALSPPVALLALPASTEDRCPRNSAHSVSLRGDGAMWCRGCDEAFYPQLEDWGAMAEMAA